MQKASGGVHPHLLVIHEVDVFLTEVSSVKDETGFLSNQSSDDLIQMMLFHILRSHSEKYFCLSSSITSNGKHSAHPSGICSKRVIISLTSFFAS